MLERARQSELLPGGEVIVGDNTSAAKEFEQVVAALEAR